MKKIISILTTLALCLSLCPAWAFALDAGETPAVPPEGAVAKVEKEGVEPSYVTNLADAFAEKTVARQSPCWAMWS